MFAPPDQKVWSWRVQKHAGKLAVLSGDVVCGVLCLRCRYNDESFVISQFSEPSFDVRAGVFNSLFFYACHPAHEGSTDLCLCGIPHKQSYAVLRIMLTPHDFR